MYNKCKNYSNSCCYMSDQKKFNKSFSFHRSMKVWNRPITTWLNIVWYCPKKCDNDILTILWKWYDIRYHDISSNDMLSTAWEQCEVYLDSCWDELWQALGKLWLTPKLSDSLEERYVKNFHCENLIINAASETTKNVKAIGQPGGCKSKWGSPVWAGFHAVKWRGGGGRAWQHKSLTWNREIGEKMPVFELDKLFWIMLMWEE